MNLLVILITFIGVSYSQQGGKTAQKWPLKPDGTIDHRFGTVSNYQQAKKGPVIVFKRTVYDFGTVDPDAVVTISYVYYNKGNGPLLLKNVQASCGCTVPDWPKRPVMPGDSAVITAIFSPKEYAGQTVNKSITVQTYIRENGQDKIITLFIKGSVRKKQ